MPAGQHLPLRVNSTAQSHSLHLQAGLPAQAPGSDLRRPPCLVLTSGGLHSLNDLGQVFGPSAPQFPGL